MLDSLFEHITLTPGSFPMWGTFALALTALIGRFTPIWKRLQIGEVAGLKAELNVVGEKVNVISARCTAYTVRVGQLEFSLAVALEELQRVAPDSAVPAQIRTYLSASIPNLDPSHTLQEDMDALRAIWKEQTHG